MRRESSHHYGHRRRFSRAEHVKVSEFKNARDPLSPNQLYIHGVGVRAAVCHDTGEKDVVYAQ